MKKAFIFDFDGTLGETIPLVLASVKAAYCDTGQTAPSEGVIKSHFGPNEIGMFRSLNPDMWKTLYGRYLYHYAALHDKYSPALFMGIRGVLRLLSEKGVPAAIVTGKGRDTADISLAKYGISEYFSVVECGDERGAVKPEKIRRVLEFWNLQNAAGSVYYIGDIVRDVYDSLEAGTVPLSAAWSKIADVGGLKKSPSKKVFESVADFRDWIEKSVI